MNRTPEEVEKMRQELANAPEDVKQMNRVAEYVGGVVLTLITHPKMRGLAVAVDYGKNKDGKETINFAVGIGGKVLGEAEVIIATLEGEEFPLSCGVVDGARMGNQLMSRLLPPQLLALLEGLNLPVKTTIGKLEEDKPSFTSLMHMAMDRQAWPEEADHLTGKERGALKRFVNMLQGKNRYAEKLAKERDEAKGKTSSVIGAMTRELAWTLQDDRVPDCVDKDTFWHGTLSNLVTRLKTRCVQQNAGAEIERITTERVTRELAQVMTGGPAPDNDTDRPFRQSWVSMLRDLRDNKRGEKHERDKLVNATKLDLAGQLNRVATGDRVTLSKDGWLGQSHWVDSLKALASTLEDLRKQPPTVSRESVMAEALRDLNRALDGKWPLVGGQRSEWAAALDRVTMVKFNVLQQCANEVLKALEVKVQVTNYQDGSSAAASWRSVIAAIYSTAYDAKDLRGKLDSIRKATE